MTRGWRWRSPPILLACIALSAPGASFAETPGPDQRAAHIAHEVVAALDLTGIIVKSMEAAASSFDGLAEVRPTWPDLARRAMIGEFSAAGPKIEEIFARRFMKEFTADELQAGEVIMTDPKILAGISAGARGEHPKFDGCGRECTRALRQPAGQRFMEKLSALDKSMGESDASEILVEVFPKFLRRLADDIEAEKQAKVGN